MMVIFLEYGTPGDGQFQRETRCVELGCVQFKVTLRFLSLKVFKGFSFPEELNKISSNGFTKSL